MSTAKIADAGSQLSLHHSSLDEIPRGLSIGVQVPQDKRSSDFRIGLTVPSQKLLHHPFIEIVNKLAHGDCEVHVVGRVRPGGKAWHFDQHAPLRHGASVGHKAVSAGSIGGFVRCRATGRKGFLSNNHVLANSNRGQIGDRILQPGPVDGGTAGDVIAELAGLHPIVFGGAINRFDSAWAAFYDRTGTYDARGLFDTGGNRIGRMMALGPENLDLFDDVLKVGRSTGCTYGQIRRFIVRLSNVPYNRRLADFVGQFEIESANRAPFSCPGESGSLILDGQFRPQAQLFAAAETSRDFPIGLTYASPIRPILDDLNLDLLME